MFQKCLLYLVLSLVIQPCLSQINSLNTNSFKIFSEGNISSIAYDVNGSSLDSIVAFLLAKDIEHLTGKQPEILTDATHIKSNCIFIGELNSSFIKEILKDAMPKKDFLLQKESYYKKVISNPFSKENKLFIIAGTDPRGTAFGVFDLSKQLGVSPWYWWADVPILKKETLIIDQEDFYSKQPTVEFRGIFLNDEDWGLQPWAANTFEPEVGDIAAKTYSKIFELLLRLKANTIWPAMHPCTKAFFHYPDNIKTAEQYHIVVGSSHAEPMLRNNVDEWKKDSLGDFNFVDNQQTVINYWEQRVKEAKNLNGIYTLGMRGVHDSGMEGVKSVEQAAQVLNDIISAQRELLSKYNPKKITEIPQVFTVYKEVLALYDYGLDLPEDVTIMWTDDNYGYIRRLGNDIERSRKGGGGVYYHISYWGRPHDYLWLSTTSPALIHEEMMKAYQTNNKKIWILNVGDIKPAEYNIDLFMDMAFNADKYENQDYLDQHLNSFYADIFGEEHGNAISKIKNFYYQLAYERKPEYMGWSQTEPTTETKPTDYNPFYWGDEIDKRLNSYKELEDSVERIKNQLPPSLADSYFELVYYPVKGAALMNKKFLYRDKAIKYAKQNRLIVKDFKKFSEESYDSIQLLTKKYNSIANGKWENMMSMAPRNLPVFHKPEIQLDKSETGNDLAGIAIENRAQSREGYSLPMFYAHSRNTHFIDVYLKKEGKASWQMINTPDWLVTNINQGELNSGKKITQQRIKFGIYWDLWSQHNQPEKASFQLKVGDLAYVIHLQLKDYQLKNVGKNTFLEENGLVSIFAENYTDKVENGDNKWEMLKNLGYSGNLVQAKPITKMPLDTINWEEESSYLSYTIYTESANNQAELIINALPTHPISNKHSVRIGVQWDENPIEILDFKTYGRSETWKLNVLSNIAKVSLPVKVDVAGKHELKIYMIDEGVALDFIYLKMKDVPLPYSIGEETNTFLQQK